MAKITEKKTETQIATEAASKQFEALNIIATHEEIKKEESASVERKAGRKDKLVTFNLPPEDAEKYKRWFGAKGISFSMGLRMCLDFIYFEDQANKIILTKSGIRENEIMRL